MTLPPVDVRDLIGHPGASRTASVGGSLEGLGSDLATLADGGRIHTDLLLESVIEGIVVSGRFAGTLELRCARCLTEFTEPLEVRADELFTFDPGDDEEVYALDPEGWLDPDQMARDVIGVELPFAPLCRPGCLGLCTRCGGDRNLDECTCPDDEIDPRWAELEHLLGGG
jgi:uncharacterized protein